MYIDFAYPINPTFPPFRRRINKYDMPSHSLVLGECAAHLAIGAQEQVRTAAEHGQRIVTAAAQPAERGQSHEQQRQRDRRAQFDVLRMRIWGG